MGKRKVNLTRLIRLSIIVFLCIIIFLIGWNFITQSKKKTKVPVETEKITPQKVEMREKIEYFEVKGGRGNFKIRADKHYIGEDNQYHLEGNVELIFFKKKEGKDVFLYGQEIIYDEDWSHFLLRGEARIKFKDILIESSALNYENKTEIFQSDKGVRFTSGSLSGTSRMMVYSTKKDEIELQDNVYIKIKPHLETSFPLEVEGQRLSYTRKGKRGTVEGPVRLTHGKSRAWADGLNFEMFANEEQIKTMYLKGQVKVTLKEKEKLVSKGRTSLIPPGINREIRAAEIKVRGFLDLPRIHELEAKGGSSVKLISTEGGFTLIQGEVIRFLLSRDGELREFEVKGKASIAEQGEGSKPIRLIEGEIITAESEAQVLHISGGKGSKPRISLKDSEIYAKEIRIFLNSNDLELSEDVKAILKLQKEEERSIGFFSREEPVFITAHKMRYTEELNRFLFKEKIKMWQERKTLTAEEVILDEETGRISCSGGVKSVAPYEPKEGEEERMEISAQTMDYKPEESIIFYQNACSLKLKDTHLQAQSIFVHLKGKKGEMENIDAHGNVVLVHHLREGHGEKAKYELEKEAIVLTGNPVLIDKDKGVVRGDKLTFYMADGRIVVENKDRERSVTVIKS